MSKHVLSTELDTATQYLVPPPTGVAATDTFNIQTKLTAASITGGIVTLSYGIYVVNASLVIYSNVVLRGAGRGLTVIYLANTTNVDLIKSFQFDSLVGGGTTGGIQMCGIYDLTLDGNKANNLTSGRGFSIYGRDFVIERVKVQNTRGLGGYSEWAVSGADMEGSCSEVKFVSCEGGAWQFKGPHDMKLRAIKAESCGGTSIEVSGNGYGSHWTDCHAWGILHNFAFDLQVDATALNCQAEGVQAGPQVRLLSASRFDGKVFGGTAPSGNVLQHAFQVGRTSPLATAGNWCITGRAYNLSGRWIDFQSDGGGGYYEIIGAVGAGLETGTPAAGTVGTYNTGSNSTSYTIVRNIHGPSSTPVLTDLGILLGSSSGPFIKSATLNPEGSTTAPISSLRARTDGGYHSALGVKANGSSSTGWTMAALRAMQTNSTDSAFTLTPDTSPEHTIFTAVMAAGRVVTLSTTGAIAGMKFKITRTAASTGAFNLDVGGLKNLAVSQWCEVTYNGSAWVLTSFGSL